MFPPFRTVSESLRDPGQHEADAREPRLPTSRIALSPPLRSRPDAALPYGAAVDAYIGATPQLGVPRCLRLAAADSGEAGRATRQVTFPCVASDSSRITRPTRRDACSSTSSRYTRRRTARTGR